MFSNDQPLIILVFMTLLCEGHNDHGPDKVPYLTMEGPEDTNARLGSNTIMRCRLTWKNMLGQRWTAATPRVDIQWSKDGFGFPREVLERSFGSRYRLNVNESAGVYDLRIQNLQKDDEGAYACQAQILNERRDPRAQTLIDSKGRIAPFARKNWQHTVNDLTTATGSRSATMPMSFVRSKEVKLSVFVPPKELHLAVNDILLANVNSCAREKGAPYENSDEEDCAQAIGWIEMDDPVKVTCSSEPSSPAAQLEWLVNGEVLLPVNFWETKFTVDQSPSTLSGDQCQCGHLCGSQEEANVTTRQMNGSVIFRRRTFTVRICRMGNQDESLLSTTSELLLTIHSCSVAQIKLCCRLRNMEKFLPKDPLQEHSAPKHTRTREVTWGISSKLLLFRVHCIHNVSIQLLDAGALREKHPTKFRCSVQPEPTNEQHLEFHWSLIYNVKPSHPRSRQLLEKTVSRRRRHERLLELNANDSAAGFSDISILPTRQMHRAVLRCTVTSSIVQQKGAGRTKPLSQFTDLVLNVTYGPSLNPPNGDIVLLSALNESFPSMTAYQFQGNKQPLRETAIGQGGTIASELHTGAFLPMETSEMNRIIVSNKTSIQLECGMDAHPQANIDWLVTRPDGVFCVIGKGLRINLPWNTLPPSGKLPTANLCLNSSLDFGFCPSDQLKFATAMQGSRLGLPNFLLQISCLARSDGFPLAKRSIRLAVPIKPHINLTVLKSFGEPGSDKLLCEAFGLPIPDLHSLELRLHTSNGEPPVVIFGAGYSITKTLDAPISIQRAEFGWSLTIHLTSTPPTPGGFYNCSAANEVGSSWKVIKQPQVSHEVNLLTVACLALLLMCLILLSALLCCRVKPRTLCLRRRRQQLLFPTVAQAPAPPSQQSSPSANRPQCLLPEMSSLGSVNHNGKNQYGRRESPVGSSETETGFFTDAESTTNKCNKLTQQGISSMSSARMQETNLKVARRSMTSFVGTLFDAGNSLSPTGVRYKKRLKRDCANGMNYFLSDED